METRRLRKAARGAGSGQPPRALQGAPCGAEKAAAPGHRGRCGASTPVAPDAPSLRVRPARNQRLAPAAPAAASSAPIGPLQVCCPLPSALVTSALATYVLISLTSRPVRDREN